MNKNTQLNIRLSNNEYELIKSVSFKMGMTLSQLILSILIPYCIKNNK